jgi:hypothetical protein
MPEVVNLRQVNRSYLARQMLLERHDISAHEAIDRLIALQAQDVMPPYVGLWSRLSTFEATTIETGLVDRSLVRATTLRPTVHLVTRKDLRQILPKMMPGYIRIAQSPNSLNGLFQRIPFQDVIDWGNKLFAEGDLGAAEMRDFARRDWPNEEPQLLASAVQWSLPVVQVPPRGLWKNNSRPRWDLAEQWLGQSLDHTYELDDLILRFIRAFGPIGTGDIQAWSGLTGLKEVVARLRPHLRVLHDESGRELLDDPDAAWPDAATPAPVRLLGAFDNLWLAHKNRERVLDDRFRLKILNNGVGRPTLLVDGFVAGRYRVRTKKSLSTLTIEPFRKFTPAERRDVVAESEKLLEFMEPGTDHEIVVVDVLP